MPLPSSYGLQALWIPPSSCETSGVLRSTLQQIYQSYNILRPIPTEKVQSEQILFRSAVENYANKEIHESWGVKAKGLTAVINVSNANSA